MNSLLNYGYTVLRAATARAVVAAGLHPSIGLHHSHDGNALRLVDDLMEPFRPIIDWAVWQLQGKGPCSINSDTKRELIKCLYQDLNTDVGRTPVLISIQKLATSLALVFTKQRRKLDFPHPGCPIEDVGSLTD